MSRICSNRYSSVSTRVVLAMLMARAPCLSLSCRACLATLLWGVVSVPVSDVPLNGTWDR